MKECFCKNSAGAYYQADDFIKAPKLDAHLHYNIFDDGIVKYAGAINMKLLTVNVDIGFPIARQLKMSRLLKKKHPGTVNFIGTFDPSGFAGSTFAEKTVGQIKKCMDAGAKGIKIWKNIGMSLRDKNGKYLMADDPVFAPVFEYLQKEDMVVLAHLGEPRNCWLPFDQMTMESDVRYFRMCPQYHMHIHPEAPTYEQQIAVRDRLLEQYPQLNFVGAHLGSLEWNLDEVADRLERYPRFSIDISGRMGHLHLHAVSDREKLCRFLTRYQDRIMYGSDFFFASWGIRGSLSYHLARRRFVRKMSHVMHQGWEKDWRFFATDATVEIEKINWPDAPGAIEGLRLPQQIVDKIFHENACSIYRI